MTNQIILSSINPTPFLKAAHGEPLHSSSCFGTYTLYVGLESVPEYPSTNLYVLVQPIKQPYSKQCLRKTCTPSHKPWRRAPVQLEWGILEFFAGAVKKVLLKKYQYIYIYILTIFIYIE